MKNVLRFSAAVLTISIGLSSFGWAASKSAAIRKVSSGKNMKVSIEVKPASSVSAYAIEEKAPGGCQIEQVDNKGSVDKNSNTIKWGVFFDKNPRTLSYKLSCSGTDAKSQEFMGMASFNGSSTEITGDKSLK